jgi:hypothetical protein
MPDEPFNVDRGDSARVDRASSEKVDRFIVDEIDSVPHLEALLLLWRSAPQHFSAAQIAEQLYIAHGQGAAIAEDLDRRGLIARDHGSAAGFFYDMHSEERNRLIEAVDITYRRELIRISGIIHSKPSPGVRAFADAFRFRKDKS